MTPAPTTTLKDLLALGRFEPAEIQREYQWQTSHVGRLLGDLLAAFQRMRLDPGEAHVEEHADHDASAADEAEDEIKAAPSPVRRRATPKRIAPNAYFLGTIMLLKQKEGQSLVVYDGLQRLVTVAILASMLRDSWQARSSLPAADIDGLLFAEGGKRRLDYVTSGRMLSAVVDKTKPTRTMSDGDFRIREAADYLAKQFTRGWDDKRRAAFLAFLRDRVQVTVTTTDNRAVAYQMFIGANSRGLRLGVGDVVKSVIAEQLRANGGTLAQVESCVAIWRRAQQRLQRDFEDFVHAVEIYQFLGEIPDANGMRVHEERHTTGERLQALFDAGSPPEEIAKWVEADFSRMAAVFEKARAHHRLQLSSGADLALRQLSFLEWKEWQPLLLSIALKHENYGSPRFAREIYALKRACYIVELLDWSEGTRRRKFMEALEAREADKSPFARQAKGKPSALYFRPNGDALHAAQRALRAPLTSKQKRGALVRLVETLHWKGNAPRTCTSNATVEHILPITAYGEWSNAFTEEQRDALTNKLGNLCILDRGTNEDIGNKEWRYKATEYVKWRGTFRGVDRALGKANEVAGRGGKHPWCPDAVQDLTEELAKLAEQSLQIA